jgi:hypothetical protein
VHWTIRAARRAIAATGFTEAKRLARIAVENAVDDNQRVSALECLGNAWIQASMRRGVCRVVHHELLDHRRQFGIGERSSGSPEAALDQLRDTIANHGPDRFYGECLTVRLHQDRIQRPTQVGR